MLSYQATLVLRRYGYKVLDDYATQTPSSLRLLDLREFDPSCQNQPGNRARKWVRQHLSCSPKQPADGASEEVHQQVFQDCGIIFGQYMCQRFPYCRRQNRLLCSHPKIISYYGKKEVGLENPYIRVNRKEVGIEKLMYVSAK